MWGIITYAYKYMVREQKESGSDYYASAECMHRLDVKYVVIFIGPHVHNTESKRIDQRDKEGNTEGRLPKPDWNILLVLELALEY